MEFSLLADHPAAAETVGRWYWDEWGQEAGESLDDSIARTASYTSRDGPPMIVLAQHGGEWLGAAQLKVREMDIYPEFEFWLGGVYVPESARGRGLAAQLVDEVKSRARLADIDRLYLQTEDLTGGLYRRGGFQPIEEVAYKGVRVLVMTASVAGDGTATPSNRS
ncbi:MAG: GNAT family N-acetyltransferase [Thermoanaerobaculia bacterium]|nr:GNAT family N-acetyltransferase [Thermoanaerobaculia bacterium]